MRWSTFLALSLAACGSPARVETSAAPPSPIRCAAPNVLRVDETDPRISGSSVRTLSCSSPAGLRDGAFREEGPNAVVIAGQYLLGVPTGEWSRTRKGELVAEESYDAGGCLHGRRRVGGMEETLDHGARVGRVRSEGADGQVAPGAAPEWVDVIDGFASPEPLVETKCGHSLGIPTGKWRSGDRTYDFGAPGRANGTFSSSKVSYVIQNGRRTGLTRRWDDEGRLILEATYRDDALDGAYAESAWNDREGKQGFEGTRGAYCRAVKCGTWTRTITPGRFREETVYDREGHRIAERRWNEQGELWHVWSRADDLRNLHQDCLRRIAAGRCCYCNQRPPAGTLICIDGEKGDAVVVPCPKN